MALAVAVRLLVAQDVVVVAQTAQAVGTVLDIVGSFAHFVRTAQDSWGIAAVAAVPTASSMIVLAAD